MIERYEEFTGFRDLPLSNSAVKVDIHGNCLIGDSPTGGVVLPSGEVTVTIKMAGLIATIPKGVLASVVSRNVHPQLVLALKYLQVHYRDGDARNSHPSNTVWKFPLGGIKMVNRDLYHIPGFSRYVISSNGSVYSFCSNKFLSPYQDEMGYWMFGLTPDVGKRTIVGQHRLLALAFLSPPVNADELDVNHLDGIKSNNHLLNLEWAGRKRNCEHAYETGLRSDNIPVLVRNSFTGEVKHYYGYEDCGRKLGTDGETIRLRAVSEGQKVYPPGYQVKRVDCLKDWATFNNPVDHMSLFSSKMPYLLQCQQTGKVTRLPNTREVAAFFGFTPGALNWYFKTKGDGCVIKGFRVCRETLQSKISPLLVETP